MPTLTSNSLNALESRAATAALKCAERRAKNRPNQTITVVAVWRDGRTDFDLVKRWEYEESYRESEFICQAIAYCENGKVTAEIEE